MVKPILEQIETWDHPAVLMDLEGRCLAANGPGQVLYHELTTENGHFEDYLIPDEITERVLKNGMLLKVSPADQGNFLLEWHSLSDAETRLALFQAVSKAVNSSLILEDIFDALGEVLRTFIPFDEGTIVILDESQNSTKVVVMMRASGEIEIRGSNTLFVGYDAVINENLLAPQSRIYQTPMPDTLLIAPNAQIALIVPLINRGVVIGFIGLSGQAYSDTHIELMEDVSDQLAVAVENARLYWQTQSQAGREFLINHITKAIRQTLDIEHILQTTVHEVGQVLGVSRCLIHYWGRHGETFDYTLPGVPNVNDAVQLSEFTHSLFLRRSNSDQQFNPFILNDCRDYKPGEDLFMRNDIKSLAVFPILLREGMFVGTITLHQCDTYRAWLNEEIALLKAIAEHVAVALHQANLYQEKENQRKQLENTLDELQRAQLFLVQTEKMAVLGQFVAGIAHEVNTPLGTIRANDDTVKRCIDEITKGNDANGQFMQTALNLLSINKMAADRIQEIVKNLRNFARLDESDLKRVDIHEGLDATLLLISRTVDEAIEIKTHYDENIPLVECFPGLLNQVFLNIIVNGAQSIEGPGTVTITTHYDAQNKRVNVSISDTGKGIEPENLPKIFDPGFTTKGVGVGTGLGLALCYKIMEKHSGGIKIQSVPHQGTTMTVYFPADQTGVT